MTRVPEDTISRGLPGESSGQQPPRTRREARERYRTSERRQARGLPSTSTGARSLRQAAKPGASLGAGYLGLGAAVLTAIEAVVRHRRTSWSAGPSSPTRGCPPPRGRSTSSPRSGSASAC